MGWLARPRSLVVYGLDMAGKSEDGEGAGVGNPGPSCVHDDGVWVGEIFALLKQVTEDAVRSLVEEGPAEDVAAAEKKARAAGVMARTAKAVLALKDYALARASKRKPLEDGEEMSEQDREFTDIELAGLKSEFFARLDRLVSGLERKGEAEGVGGKPAARGARGGAGDGAEPAAEP